MRKIELERLLERAVAEALGVELPERRQRVVRLQRRDVPPPASVIHLQARQRRVAEHV